MLLGFKSKTNNFETAIRLFLIVMYWHKNHSAKDEYTIWTKARHCDQRSQNVLC